MISVTPGEHGKVAVRAHDEDNGTSVDLLQIDEFVGMDFTFRVLEGLTDPETFCRTLESIMRGRGIYFFVQGQPLTSTPTNAAMRPKYKCQHEFPEQVQIMRHLHPDLEKAAQTEMLNQKSKEWRAKAKKAMHFEGSMCSWGGQFKVPIFIACLSHRCYAVVRSIIDNRRSLFLKANAQMFNPLVGYPDEQYLFLMLKKVESGEMALKDLSIRVTEAKRTARDAEPNIEGRDLQTLLKEIDRLKKENIDLKNQLKRCICQNNQEDKDMSFEQSSVNIEELSSSREIFNFSYEERETEKESLVPLSQVRERRRAYTVSYKPASDESESLDDSLVDPDFNIQDSDVSSSDQSDEHNKAFSDATPSEERKSCIFQLSDLKRWDPRQCNAITASVQDIDENEDGLPMEQSIQLQEPYVALKRVDSEVKEQAKEVDETKQQEVKQQSEVNEVDATKEDVKQKEMEMTRKRRRSAMKYEKGQRVLAEFVNGGKKSWREWLPAVIVGTFADGAMFQVKFDDNCLRFVKKEQIRPDLS